MSKFTYHGKDQSFGERFGFGGSVKKRRKGGGGGGGNGSPLPYPTNDHGVVEPQNYGSYGKIPGVKDPAQQPPGNPVRAADATADLQDRANSSAFGDNLSQKARAAKLAAQQPTPTPTSDDAS